MQTFLPYSNMAESARVLDYQRLGKQRVETWQILRALAGETKGWVNHPATKMWRGYEYALSLYGIFVCEEWRARGYKDTMLERFVEICENATKNLAMPEWLGDDRLHLSHQSNLVRKLPEHYGPIFPEVPSDLEYFWPV